MQNFRFAVAAGAAAMLASSMPAAAHPKLVSATPAAGSITGGKSDIALHFSEKLVARFSGASLSMTDMPKMTMKAPMAMTGVRSSLGADGKTLMVHSNTALPTGTYQLNWHAVSTDTHRVTGSYGFKVK